jgi:hypothetical protein
MTTIFKVVNIPSQLVKGDINEKVLQIDKDIYNANNKDGLLYKYFFTVDGNYYIYIDRLYNDNISNSGHLFESKINNIINIISNGDEFKKTNMLRVIGTYLNYRMNKVVMNNSLGKGGRKTKRKRKRNRKRKRRTRR